MKYLITILTFLIISVNLHSQSFSFYRTSEAIINTNDTFGVISHAIINNLTVIPNTLRLIKWVENFPSGWESCICDIVICHPTGVDTAIADYPPGLSNIDVMLYAHSIPGTGFLTIRTEKVSNPSEYVDVVFGGSYSPLGIYQISSIVKDFSLGQNYPNPYNPVTKINFSIPKNNYVSLVVYDILGKEVKVLVNEKLSAGEYETDFDAEGLASGMYYYTLRAGDNVSLKKMVLIK